MLWHRNNFSMTPLKKILRVFLLICLILLACAGAGFGVILPVNRERSFDNEIKIELVEKREEDEIEEKDVE